MCQVTDIHVQPLHKRQFGAEFRNVFAESGHYLEVPFQKHVGVTSYIYIFTLNVERRYIRIT
jgi:hypothetical protein